MSITTTATAAGDRTEPVGHADIVGTGTGRSVEAGVRMGFFTDTSVCIGCKACEVACKEWNDLESIVGDLTGQSYDNTGALTADNWRHVTFIEKVEGRGGSRRADGDGPHPLAPPAPSREPEAPASPGDVTLPTPMLAPDGPASVVWLMSSDVCKHCTHAACLDVCPTGSLVKTEFDTVVVQPDICNGCGYCVPACPFGVIGRDESTGGAAKCTLCYDRLKGDQTPACAHACPTDSIQFGPLDELRERAGDRLVELRDAGEGRARLYGEDPEDGIGGAGAFFLLLDEPDVYGLPPAPVATTRDLPGMWRTAAATAVGLVVTVGALFLGSGS